MYAPEGCILPSSALCSAVTLLCSSEKISAVLMCAQKCDYSVDGHVSWVSVQLLCSTGNPIVKAHLTFSVQPPWTSPTKRHCRAQPGTAAAFCQVASRRYCCTGGCMGRSLWDPSLLQRRICENNLFFYSIEFSRETRAQSWSNTAVKEPSIILPQAQHL